MDMIRESDRGNTAAAALRRNAEQRLRATPSDRKQASLPLEEAQKLLYEIEVHQVELELQNAELCEARDATEAALDKVTELYDFAPVGYFTLNRGGAILAVNLFGAKMLKTERSHLIGSAFRLLVAPEARSDFDAFLRQISAGQAKKELECAIVTKESVLLYVQIEAVCSRGGTDCLIALIDITERKQAANALIASETRYRRLFETAKDAIFIVDGATGQIADVNPSLAGMLGYCLEDCLQKQLWEIGVFTDAEACRLAFLELQRTGYLHCEQLSLQAKDGTMVFAELVGNAYRVDGKQVIQCTIRDITGRVEALRALREKDRQMTQQCRMAAMGEMLGFLAHQWRQPLNLLGLNLQELTLSRKLGSFDLDLLDCNVAKAMGILRDMSRTIDYLMAFTRQEQEKCLFSVNDVIAKVISLVEALFQSHKIRIEFAAGEVPDSNGFPNEFAQVLLNILVNAKDAHLERKTADAWIKVHSGTSDGRAVVTIADNAGGVSAEIIDKIFDAFSPPRNWAREPASVCSCRKRSSRRTWGGVSP